MPRETDVGIRFFRFWIHVLVTRATKGQSIGDHLTDRVVREEIARIAMVMRDRGLM